jgi:hypothetical protein
MGRAHLFGMDGGEEEAEESTTPPKKQRMNDRGVGYILSYIE